MNRDLAKVQDSNVVGELLQDSLVLPAHSPQLTHRVNLNQGGVTAMALDPYETDIFVATADGNVEHWDRRSSSLRRTLCGHQAPATAIAVREARIASAGSDGVAIRNRQSGDLLRTLPIRSDIVTCLTMNSSATLCVCGDSLGNVGVFDAGTAETVAAFTQHSRAVNAVAFVNDKLVLSGGADGLFLWEAPTGRLLTAYVADSIAMARPGLQDRFGCRSHTPAALQFHCKGNLLASGWSDAIRLWDRRSGKRLLTLNTGCLGEVLAIQISPDGNMIATGHADGTIAIWNATQNRILRKLTGHREWVVGLVWALDGALLSASLDGSIREWNPSSGTCVSVTRDAPGVNCLGLHENALALARGSEISLYDLASGRLNHTCRAHRMDVTAIQFSPSGAYVASAGKDRRVTLRSVENEQCVRELRAHKQAVLDVKFSSDGQYLLAAGADGIVVLWDLRTGGHAVYDMLLHGPIAAVCFCPDETQFLAIGQETLRRVSVATGEIIMTYESEDITAGEVVVSAGEIVCGGSDGRLRWYHMEKSKPVRSAQAHQGSINSMIVVDDFVLTGGADGRLRLWDPVNGGLVHSFEGAGHRITRGGLASHGGRFVAACGSGAVRLFAYRGDFRSLGTLHHAPVRHVFSTPPEENAPSGWFWTSTANQTDVIEVFELAAGKPLRSLPTDDPRRQSYRATYNNKARVLAKINESGPDDFDQAFLRLVDARRRVAEKTRLLLTYSQE